MRRGFRCFLAHDGLHRAGYVHGRIYSPAEQVTHAELEYSVSTIFVKSVTANAVTVGRIRGNKDYAALPSNPRPMTCTHTRRENPDPRAS